MYIKTVEYGQDIFDLSIQEYGTVEAVFMVLFDNSNINLSAFLLPGTQVSFREDPPEVAIDAEVMAYMRKNEIRINNNDEPLAGSGNWHAMDGSSWWTTDDQTWQTTDL